MSVQEHIIQFILTDIHPNQQDLTLEASDDLLSSGLLTSMDMVRLIEFIENNFEIGIPPQDMTIDNFISVEAMANYVSSQKAQ